MKPGEQFSKQPLYRTNWDGEITPCEHCQGRIRHQPWCITRNATVAYVFAAALDLRELTREDQILLHALGVSWPSTVSASKV